MRINRRQVVHSACTIDVNVHEERIYRGNAVYFTIEAHAHAKSDGFYYQSHYIVFVYDKTCARPACVYTRVYIYNIYIYIASMIELIEVTRFHLAHPLRCRPARCPRVRTKIFRGSVTSRGMTSYDAGLPKVVSLFLSGDTNKICRGRRRRLYFNPILYLERIEMSSHRLMILPTV